jgi:CRP/FNR family cyclic AMP-dependent transcriptional regulator
MSSRMIDRLPSEVVRLLAKRGTARRVAKGSLLIREGEISDVVYILVSGQLKVFTRGRRDREQVFNVLGAGEVLGEMFLDGGPRSASVAALTDAECVEIAGGEIRTLLRECPDFAELLVMKLISRLRHATSQVRGLALEGVYERTVSVLKELAQPGTPARYIPAMTQQEIANHVGATREMVNQVIRGLIRDGFLTRDQDQRLLILKELPA